MVFLGRRVVFLIVAVSFHLFIFTLFSLPALLQTSPFPAPPTSRAPTVLLPSGRPHTAVWVYGSRTRALSQMSSPSR